MIDIVFVRGSLLGPLPPSMFILRDYVPPEIPTGPKLPFAKSIEGEIGGGFVVRNWWLSDERQLYRFVK